MSQTETPSMTKSGLSQAEAGSRLVIVTVIQLIGVSLLIAPLLIPGVQGNGWQRHCLLFALLGVVGVVLLLIAFFHAAKQRFKDPPLQFDVRKTELAITSTFILNTIALSLAMARTGGPSCSTYGQIIPMQLSGMLLLAQQKQAFTHDRSIRPVIYPVITLVLWGVAAFCWPQLIQWRGWPTSTGTNQPGWFLSPSLLISLEIILMAIAYFIPRKFSSRDEPRQVWSGAS